MDITPFHEGWCYFTSDDGKFYIDSIVGSNNKRICINPDSKGGSVAVNGTLTKNGWVNGQQTLQVSGLKANQNGIIGIAQNITDSQMEAAKLAELYVSSQAEGALTVSAFGEVPKTDIPVVTILMA